MKKSADFNDDLIGGSQEPIIIHQDGSSDKKFIYSILILLVVLFIIALAVIAYLGSKFFNTPSANSSVKTEIAESKNQNKTAIKPSSFEEKAIKESIGKNKQKEMATATVSLKDGQEKEGDVAELESILNEEKSSKVKKEKSESDKKIEEAVSNATGGVKLSPEDLEKIAELVAKQLKQSSIQAKSKTLNSTSKKATNDEEALVQTLQAAATDTLKEETIDVEKVAQNNRKITKESDKKIDTYNKVIVKESSGKDDEFAQLSKEIDQILQTEEVKKSTQKEKKIKSDIIKERKQEVRFIVVRKGDTLSSIARRAYGRASAYIKIYKANPDIIKNPDRIYIGMKLRVPIDEEYQGNAR